MGLENADGTGKRTGNPVVCHLIDVAGNGFAGTKL